MKRIIYQIIDDIISLGVSKGDSLLVHSSLSSLGKFEDQAKIVTEALLSVLGKEGTLLMPTLSYETVGDSNPYFDLNKTPSCVGGLTEYFRLRDDTIRSIHPTHSVAGIGKNAKYFLLSHHFDSTPAGRNSPFAKLKEVNGKILFLGCGLKPNTSMHGVEELVEPQYLFKSETEYTILADGKEIKKKFKNHNFRGYTQRYDRIKNLLREEYLNKGKVLKAEVYLIDSTEMWKVAYKKLLENPLYFVDKVKA